MLVPLPPAVGRAIDRAAQERTTGPILLNTLGAGMDRHGATRRLRRIADSDGELAGIMDVAAFLPEGVPAHWSVYCAVDDADATVAKVKALGGSVVMDAEDIPYSRLAVATDPAGAQFKMRTPNQ